eukprot:6339214-Lingulodinium_polyedra.AAC.1
MDTTTATTGRRHRSTARAASTEDPRATRARRSSSQPSIRSFLHAIGAIARGRGGDARAPTGGEA